MLAPDFTKTVIYLNLHLFFYINYIRITNILARKGESMAIITISRGTLTASTNVAALLSERLGYPSLSREEASAEAARDYDISTKELRKSLDGKPFFWQQVPGKRLAYVKCVTAVMLSHMENGNLIYHGHVGHLLFSDISEVLRVRIIADMEYRIRTVMEKEKLNQNEAVAYVERVDKDRSRWVRLLYGVEWTDPTQYDLILNVGRLGEENVCETIATMAKQKDLQSTPESQKRLRDFSLSCRVWAELAKARETRSLGIQVNADDGEVTIGGSANSVKAKEMIPVIAKSVDGVTSVTSDVGVGKDWYW